MEFRPCIDLHNGKVKQIIGSTLSDRGDMAGENFVSERDAAYYAKLYQSHGLSGGHVVMLNGDKSPYFEENRRQALKALAAYPGGMQLGGGICRENAAEYLRAGAGHVIVTSYVFHGGRIDMDRLRGLCAETGREHLVLDLSCKKRVSANGEAADEYIIMADRWQRFTEERISRKLLDQLSEYADEFLVHAVDAEGRSCGIDEGLARLLGSYERIPITYAGGVKNFKDLEKLYELGEGRLHVTIGSALDLFGGSMCFLDVLEWCRKGGRK